MDGETTRACGPKLSTQLLNAHSRHTVIVRRTLPAGRMLRLAAERIGRLGIEDEAVQAVAELLLKEEGVFMRHMAARDMKARHFASYAATYSREPAGRARKRKS